MGYPIGLDEYEDTTLINELLRRRQAELDDKCSYCTRTRDTQKCKFPSRHTLAETKTALDDLMMGLAAQTSAENQLKIDRRAGNGRCHDFLSNGGKDCLAFFRTDPERTGWALRSAGGWICESCFGLYGPDAP